MIMELMHLILVFVEIEMYFNVELGVKTDEEVTEKIKNIKNE
jgi:hypothetical protein